MCGLCGNFDGNINNDLMSSNNQLEVDPSHFGNSWKVVPSCADVTQVTSGLKASVYSNKRNGNIYCLALVILNHITTAKAAGAKWNCVFDHHSL